MPNQTIQSELNKADIDVTLLKEVPLSFAKRNQVLPLYMKDNILYGAVSGNNGRFALREIASRKGMGVKAILMDGEDLIAEINRLYGQIGSAEEVMETISGEDLSTVATEFESPRDLLELTNEAPIIRLLNALLQQAVKERASDIHIEPYEKEIDVRMRVDGILRTVLRPPKIIQDALISRVKIMSNLDIAEKRLPQDGRIRILIGGKDIDVRVSAIPTVHGERAVLRLLDRKQGVIGLHEVGLDEKDRATLEEMLKKSSGILLVTGPTGSGKTTTLYAALNRTHSDEKNIITVEDPVEYQLRGVGQIQVNPKIGLTFASGLRSIVRQDPDVIMVGEIRDTETAEIAIQASLTGHLVLSTLHTNDAPSAISRLVDMEVEPFLVASSLIGIIAQRLVRIICPHCRVVVQPSEQERDFFSEMNVRPEKLSKGKGCNFCNQTGYFGRTGLFEFLKVDSAIRPLITEGVDAHAIRDVALSKGLRTLRMDGLRKVLKGITSLEEVLRVTQTFVE
jgi:general secretion pathway protein E